MTEQKRETLSTSERIELKRKGSSDFLRLPAKWRNTFQKLQGNLIFEATYQEDQNGIPYIVFKKVKEQKP